MGRASANPDGLRGRRSSIGNLLKKAQDIYQAGDIVSINQDEFCKEVHFQFGVPLLVVEIFENLTGSKIISKLKKSMLSNAGAVKVEPYDEELLLLKSQIHEDYYNNYLINLFQSLG